jgi:hypothetical protein
MARMFRVLSFWALVISLMAFAGGEELIPMGLIFLFQTTVFLALSYMNLTERTYILIFWGYMLLSFTGFTYWSFFKNSVEAAGLL